MPSLPALPDQYLEVRIDFRRRATTSGASSCAAVGDLVGGACSRRRRSRGAVDRSSRRSWRRDRHADPRSRERHGAGGLRHRRPRGRAGVVALGAGQAPRREPHPGDRVRLSPGARRALGDLVRGRRQRPGSVHRPARRGGLGQGHRPGPAGPDDRGVQPRPAGLPVALRRPSDRARSIDARRSEVFWAFYRQVPGGVQRVSEPTVGHPTTWPPSCWPSPATRCCAGDGAVRYAEVLVRAARGRGRRG